MSNRDLEIMANERLQAEAVALRKQRDDLLAACENEVPQLANLARMVDPELTEQLMEVVYAAIAAARGTR